MYFWPTSSMQGDIMNKKIVQILVFSFMVQDVFAEHLKEIKCQINNNTGYVNVAGKFGLQNVVAYIGTESFDDPYKFRKICNSLKTEIRSVISERWEDFGCDQTEGIEIKLLGFQLTQQGAKILHNDSQKIWFSPALPLTEEFTRKIYSPTCDPL